MQSKHHWETITFLVLRLLAFLAITPVILIVGYLVLKGSSARPVLGYLPYARDGKGITHPTPVTSSPK